MAGPSFVKELRNIQWLLDQLKTATETLSASLERVDTADYNRVLDIIKMIQCDIRDAQETLPSAIENERRARTQTR